MIADFVLWFLFSRFFFSFFFRYRHKVKWRYTSIHLHRDLLTCQDNSGDDWPPDAEIQASTSRIYMHLALQLGAST
jgi:hypothetical protein